jgi:hypothetical protein
VSYLIGSYLLRVANLNAKAMFLNIPKTKQAAILCIKSKIDISEEYTEKIKLK